MARVGHDHLVAQIHGAWSANSRPPHLISPFDGADLPGSLPFSGRHACRARFAQTRYGAAMSWLRPHLRGFGGRWQALVVGLVTTVLVTFPAGPPWREIVGDPLGEADNHLWMFWREVHRLAGDPRILDNAPEGVPIPLMDPVNVPAFLVGWPFGPQSAWFAVILFNVGLASIGGWMLARSFVGPRAAWIGMVGTAAAPFLGGVADFGITESLPVGWFAIHAAALLHHGRTGKRGWAVLAGLSLAAIALSGWYHAFFGLLLDAMLVPVLLWRFRRLGLVWQGTIGLVLALPFFIRFRAALAAGAWAGRFHVPSAPPPSPRRNWAELPIFGTDLLNLVVPRLSTVHPSMSVYLGLVLLALVGIGLWKRPRVAGPLVALALPFLGLALGYWPSVAGHALGVPGLAMVVVHLAPPMTGLSHWNRAVGPALPLLAGAAAVGAEPVVRGRFWRAALLCGLLLFDDLAFSQTAWPRTAYAPDTPRVFSRLEGSQGVVEIPFDNGRKRFAKEPARRYQRWQVFHGFPISENYEGVDALLARSRLIAAIQGICGVRSTLPPEQRPPREMEDVLPPVGAALQADLHQLVAWNYGWLVVHLDRCRGRKRFANRVDEIVGVPHTLVGHDAFWDLQAALSRQQAAPDRP